MDHYLLMRMTDLNRDELVRVRNRRDWQSILRKAR